MKEKPEDKEPYQLTLGQYKKLKKDIHMNKLLALSAFFIMLLAVYCMKDAIGEIATILNNSIALPSYAEEGARMLYTDPNAYPMLNKTNF